MTSPPTNHGAATSSLPQYGFGKDVDFDSLLKDNHFLFRVYTPKAPSPFADDTEPLLVAPKFNERFIRSPKEPKRPFVDYGGDFTHIGTYSDVVNHMDWTTKSSSPYISTSFSFIWSIWEALRRYHSGVKKDVEIAVIDASAVAGKAVTAVQLLRTGLPTERRKEHWKWYRFAQESQSVLVYHSIPAEAVFASIPLLNLIEKLPSYFLQQSVMFNLDKRSTLAAVGWDYTEKKRNYRQFCQEMSNRFLQLAPEARLQDTTTGSVRLALAFLRPWFHQQVAHDFQAATITLCALSFSIAQWPGQWWAQEHTELWDLIRAIVLSVAEEVQATDKGHDASEIVQLREVITNLEDAVEGYKKEIRARVNRKPPHLLTPLLIPPPLRSLNLPNSPSPLVLEPTSSNLAIRPHVVVTPLTPPTSPIRPRATVPSFDKLDLDDHISNDETSVEGPSTTNDDLFKVSSPVVKEADPPVVATGTLLDTSANPVSLVDSVHSPSVLSSPEPEHCISLPKTPPIVSRPLEDLSDLYEPSMTDSFLPHPLPNASSDEIEAFIDATETRRRPPTIAETASCLVTGFFVGAFITLCLLSPQRRTMLLHLT